jgi:hypothetical protein
MICTLPGHHFPFSVFIIIYYTFANLIYKIPFHQKILKKFSKAKFQVQTFKTNSAAVSIFLLQL